MDTMTVTANEVQLGDFLIGLDMGCVFEHVSVAADLMQWSDYYSGRLEDSLVYIGFHDANGNENHLLLQDDHEVEVRR